MIGKYLGLLCLSFIKPLLGSNNDHFLLILRFCEDLSHHYSSAITPEKQIVGFQSPLLESCFQPSKRNFESLRPISMVSPLNPLNSSKVTSTPLRLDFNPSPYSLLDNSGSLPHSFNQINYVHLQGLLSPIRIAF